MEFDSCLNVELPQHRSNLTRSSLPKRSKSPANWSSFTKPGQSAARTTPKPSSTRTWSEQEVPAPTPVPEPAADLSSEERVAYYATDLMNAIGAEFIADHDYPAPVFHARSSAPEKETVKKRPAPPHEVDLLFTPPGRSDL